MNDYTTKKPKLTMLVSCFNQQSTIEKALFSALNQTYSPLEVVISDDCSNDDSFGIISKAIKSYKGETDIIINRNEANLGVVGNCNRGVELSSGEIIIFCGGDDISRSDRAEKIADIWCRHDYGPMLIYSDFTRISINGEILQKHCLAKDLPTQNTALMVAKYYLNAGAQAWSRSLFDIFGPLSSHALVEDVPMTFRAALVGKIVHLKEPVLLYREGGTSDNLNTKTGQLKRAQWREAAYKCYLDDLKKVDIPNKKQIEVICKKELYKATVTAFIRDLRVNNKEVSFVHLFKIAIFYRSLKPLRYYIKKLLSSFLR